MALLWHVRRMRLDVGFCLSALTAEEFEARIDVSRETMDRLRAYADLLTERQKVQNLVSRNSLDYLWDRHMLDSIQLAELVPQDAVSLTDIGSGGGFPGLVLAIYTGLPTTLIESHGRKCGFLQDVIDATEAPARVVNDRIEAFAGESKKNSVDILTPVRSRHCPNCAKWRQNWAHGCACFKKGRAGGMN